MTGDQEQARQQTPEERLDAGGSAEGEREGTEKPQVTDEHKQRAKEMADSYRDDRPTVKMPGTGGTIAGTAVADWIDDDKKPDEGSDHKGDNN